MAEATLAPTEYHPMAPIALEYVQQNLNPVVQEALASSALAGNRTAEICLSTYNRIIAQKPISDRYVMGLALFLMTLNEEPAWLH